MLAAANVVDRIARIIAYPVVARLSDILVVLNDFRWPCSSQNIEAYVASEVFGAIGYFGYSIMQQVFIADTVSTIRWYYYCPAYVDTF